MATLSSKAATDSFLIADYNAVIQALREILGITDDGQAYIDLGDDHQLRLDNSSTLVKVLNSQLYFEDANQGAWPLNQLGGVALQEELWYGNPGLVDDDNPMTVVVNEIYLQAIYVPKTVTVDTFVVFGGFAALDAICGIYDTSGNLLATTGSFTQTGSGEKKVAFGAYSLAAGTYYIAWVGDTAASTVATIEASTLKSVAAGSFTLPSTIVIPAGFVTKAPTFVLVPTSSPAFAG